MTRTTELLKGCKGTLDYLTQDEVVEINGVCRENCLCDKCESELRGRLDALKEKRDIWMTKIPYSVRGKWFDKELASIQEEIKLIENAGVGK